MKIRNKAVITFIFTLLACLMFQTLPILGLNNLQAQDLLPMPTYDVEPDGATIYPDLSDYGNYYDGHIFRTALCKINLIVDIQEINNLLEGTGWEAFAYGPGREDGETTVEIQWLYRIFSQWPDYDELTHETIGSMFLGTLARKEGVGLAFLVFADVRSPGNAVDLINDTVGGGRAEVSREGRLDITFRSKSKPGKKETLKFKAMVREPISGLDVKVNATFPEGQVPSRVVRNPSTIQILFMDLSTFPADEGRPFRWWVQQDRYDFDETTQHFELKVSIPDNKLKLPGDRVLPVKKVRQSLSLRRNIEIYSQFTE